jgi:hypothetical protein
VVLKDSGYVIFDHTGDMFPDIWWDEDVRAVQAALTRVLLAEGAEDPRPVIFIAAHFFSDSHGVQPAEHALGAKSCNDCHGDAATDAGAHRVTDRVVNFLPWAPPWFREENRALRYDPEQGMVPANPDGLFVVDGEVDYIHPVAVNGLHILGAREDEILALSRHHAENLFSLTAEGTVRGADIFGVETQALTPAEQATEYVRQVVNGPWMDKLHFYIPEELKPRLAACGFLTGEDDIYLRGRGFARAHVLSYELLDEGAAIAPAAIIRLPFTGAEPEIWRKGAHDPFFNPAAAAAVVGHQGGYVLVKVLEPGEYAAVEPGAGGGSSLLYELWGAFMK